MPATWETTALLTVVIPMSLLRGLSWLLLPSLMPVLSDLFVPQTSGTRRADTAATFDARPSRLPTPPFEILNPALDSRQHFSISASQLMLCSEPWNERL